jgi:hypothetical protein
MSKPTLRNAIGICIVMLMLAGTIVPTSGQSKQASPEPPKGESKIWGWWPLVPWDGQQSRR